ncbi:NUDIX hydrolase [Pedobacter mucosus]|uniref:NUDIX hydrolase n=1 Tax=Pedobacter mucosus TaxID=2895286 RepID=UPI001EE4D6CE|nr:NUDIX domain-containing protein [Pedobacter mucosus]UKT66067.1 NUDIX domain-containing protein [Pedobacter mucosus]
MAIIYRIYINNNTLFISDVLPEQKEKIQQLEFQNFDLQTFYQKLKNGSKKSYIFLTKNPQETFRKLKKDCTIIKAAGGLVESASGNFLFIFRNKKWDLPKGKLEDGEKMKETAVREVEEECGIKVLKRENKLCRTYHVYPIGTKMVIKKTNWYKMIVKSEPKLIPQKEEGIDEAVWLDRNHLMHVVKNTFPSIMDVMRAGGIL